MAQIPLGVGAFSRPYGKLPEIRCENRFFEQNPLGAEKTALLSRPGSKLLLEVGEGPIRTLYAQHGVFNYDLFVVSGTKLYRWDGSEDEPLLIEGDVLGTGNPVITTVRIPDWEALFITDGVTLQHYLGERPAVATLSIADGGITEGDLVVIDGVYYEFGNVQGGGSGTVGDPYLVAIDAGNTTALANLYSAINGGAIAAISATATATLAAPLGTDISDGDVVAADGVHYRWSTDISTAGQDGSSGDPWRVAIGDDDSESFQNLFFALAVTGTPGTDYNAGVSIHPTVGVRDYTTGGSDTFEAYALTPGTAGNAIAVSSTAPEVVWSSANLTGGAAATTFPAHSTVGARKLNVGASFEVYALTAGKDGNGIEVSSTTATLVWSASTLTGGTAHELLPCSVPDSAGVIDLVTLASHVVCAIGESHRFYWIRPGEVDIDPLDFSSAEAEPDFIVNVLAVGDQLWIFGQSSTESWYASGDADQPFIRSQGRAFSQGVIPGSIARVQDAIVVVGQDMVAYRIAGAPERISHHGVEEKLRTWQDYLRVEI